MIHRIVSSNFNSMIGRYHRAVFPTDHPPIGNRRENRRTGK